MNARRRDDNGAAASEATVSKQRRIQAEQDRAESAKGSQGAAKKAPVQAGARRHPEKTPAQHIAKPGREAELELAPQFMAPDYKGSGKLEGFAAIVTGADSGIGRAVAVLFAREGADVTVAYLDEHEDAEETRRCVEAEGRRCVLVAGDVKKPKFAEKVVKKTLDAFGRLDVLVNNAAFQEHAESLEDITDERFEETFRTNIFGYFHMARAALPHLKPGAAIINTGSVTGLEGSAEAARLLGDQGRDPRLHEVARPEPAREGHPRQRGRARSRMDAAQSCRFAGRESRAVRQRHRHEASCAAGGAVAGLRVPRLAGLRRLHQRHRPAGHGQRRRDLRRPLVADATGDPRCTARALRTQPLRAPRRSTSSPWPGSAASSRNRARRRRAPRCARGRCGSSSDRRG